MYSFGLLLQRLFTGSSPSSLAEQPLTRARLMDAMGVVYTNLGLDDEALPTVQPGREEQKGSIPGEPAGQT